MVEAVATRVATGGEEHHIAIAGNAHFNNTMPVGEHLLNGTEGPNLGPYSSYDVNNQGLNNNWWLLKCSKQVVNRNKLYSLTRFAQPNHATCVL